MIFTFFPQQTIWTCLFFVCNQYLIILIVHILCLTGDFNSHFMLHFTHCFHSPTFTLFNIYIIHPLSHQYLSFFIFCSNCFFHIRTSKWDLSAKQKKNVPYFVYMFSMKNINHPVISHQLSQIFCWWIISQSINN